jgi:hypothetical protein
MTAKSNVPIGAAASVARRPPVRVKLRRINADLAKAHPPDAGVAFKYKDYRVAVAGKPTGALCNLARRPPAALRAHGIGALSATRLVRK